MSIEASSDIAALTGHTADRGYPGCGVGGWVFAEVQGVGDVLIGQGFRGCYPLDHIGEPCGVPEVGPGSLTSGDRQSD
jgi:hypothetical protein